MISLPYYFGVLIPDGYTEPARLRFCVPNPVVRWLYVEQLRERLLPERTVRGQAGAATEALYGAGDLPPLRVYRDALLPCAG